MMLSITIANPLTPFMHDHRVLREVGVLLTRFFIRSKP